MAVGTVGEKKEGLTEWEKFVQISNHSPDVLVILNHKNT